MLADKTENQIGKIVKRYMKKEGRIAFELKELNELLRNKLHFSHFAQIFKQKLSLASSFKLLILIHRLIIENVQSSDKLLELLNTLSYSPCGDL